MAQRSGFENKIVILELCNLREGETALAAAEAKSNTGETKPGHYLATKFSRNSNTLRSYDR